MAGSTVAKKAAGALNDGAKSGKNVRNDDNGAVTIGNSTACAAAASRSSRALSSSSSSSSSWSLPPPEKKMKMDHPPDHQEKAATQSNENIKINDARKKIVASTLHKILSYSTTSTATTTLACSLLLTSSLVSSTTESSSTKKAPAAGHHRRHGDESSNNDALMLIVKTARQLFDKHGFRTALVSYPRPALSIYKDSCTSKDEEDNSDNLQQDGREFLSAMLGMHPLQAEMEELYKSSSLSSSSSSASLSLSIKDLYCLFLFCQRLREACPQLFTQESSRLDATTTTTTTSTSRDTTQTMNDLNMLVADTEKACLDRLAEYLTTTKATNDEADIMSIPSVQCHVLKIAHAMVAAATTLANQTTCSTGGTPTTTATTKPTTTTTTTSLRIEQLQQEWTRIKCQNSTMANVCLQQFWNSQLRLHEQSNNNGCCPSSPLFIQDIFFKTCPTSPKYERFILSFHDTTKHQQRRQPLPSRFTFIPSLGILLTAPTSQDNGSGGGGGGGRGGIDGLVNVMVDRFWYYLLRRGYFCATNVRNSLGPELRKYFTSAICGDNRTTIPLRAQFMATSSTSTTSTSMQQQYPLSLYLQGCAGTGKSSLAARHFGPALAETLQEMVDPELSVHVVKQNLNKPMEVLTLELDLRPNNNDLSVMSIIQGRRMTLGQTKPGLVVVDLEELAQYTPSATLPDAEDVNNNGDTDLTPNPNQLDTAQLLSQRFSGRKGAFRPEQSDKRHPAGAAAAPRNATNRGISGDASIIVIFTSNYDLAQPSRDALERLEMFRNLRTIPMENGLTGKDRRDFAHAYLRQCLQDYYHLHQQEGHHKAHEVGTTISCSLDDYGLDMDIPLGQGDTRPLVRHLRMLAFYTGTMLFRKTATARSNEEQGATPMHHISIVQEGKHCRIAVKTTSANRTTTEAPDEEVMELQVGSLENLFPVKPQIFHRRTGTIMTNLHTLESSPSYSSRDCLSELSVIIDFWLSRTLTPAVVVSNDRQMIANLMTAFSKTNDGDNGDNSSALHCIRNINPSTYKMMKSLYDTDENDTTPNLRHDIMQLGCGALVAVELVCETHPNADQLCIREMLEDTPSMTAFSSDQSALYKDGLLFAVYIQGDKKDITPEILSRASLVV